MFIKEAYEKRQKLNEQEQDILNNELRIHKIGSIKNHKVNYDKDEQFFSNEDMRQGAPEVKQYIRNYVDPDILGLRKKEWNNSVSVPKNPLAEETHERKLVKIRLGLFDHPIPKERPNIIYGGTETRNDYTNWNVSTEINQKQIRDDLLSKTQLAQTKNKTKEQQILKNYIQPIDHQTRITDDMRRQKSQEKEIRDLIRVDFIKSNPAASQEAIDGAVFRLAYEAKVRKTQLAKQDKDITFKADLSQTLKHDLEIRKYHNGVFSQQPDGSMAWSCCMSEERECKVKDCKEKECRKHIGCQKLIIDKNKWDYSSFNH